MAGNLTTILPLEDLSFPGLADVGYVKLLAALAAFPAVVIILNALGQLVQAFRITRWWDLFDGFSFSSCLATRPSLRSCSIGCPS